MILNRNDIRVAQDLVLIAREVEALGIDADPDAVDNLTTKLLSRLGPAKGHPLRMYDIEMRSNDTVEQLARAWAKVLLSQ